MKVTLSLFIIVLVFQTEARAQGCVAIRHFSCSSAFGVGAALMNPGELTLGTSYRYFKSFRHFRGTHEEPDRVANGTEVINHAHAMDLYAQYALSHRTYATITLPFVVNTRSSLYEHGRTQRSTTFSRGLADARVSLGYWLLNPRQHANMNLALALGLKVPTGDYSANDLFYNVGPDGQPAVRPVDQSIQPGDGGVGLTVDVQWYHRLAGDLSWSGSGFYLLNPREMNGVRTFRESLSPTLMNEAVMSVPDQYAIRAGLSYAIPSYGASAMFGIRYEGVPVEDLVGGSHGFRRPGSVFSVEPGVSYMRGPLSFNVSVPLAVIRNRPQSVTDRETELLTGTPRNGDAAFADYSINLGISYRLNARPNLNPPASPENF